MRKIRLIPVALALIVTAGVIGYNAHDEYGNWRIIGGTGMKQATLSEDHEERTIKFMVRGEIGYTMPWGMWADSSRNLWLNPDYPIYPQTGGTAEMRVELRSDGYHVWPPADWKYSIQQEVSYSGQFGTVYLPVAKVETGD